MRFSISLTAVAIAAAILMAAPAGAMTGSSTSSAAVQVTSLRHGIQWHRAMTWHYQDAAGVARTPTRYVERRATSTAFLRWVDRLWSARQIRARHLAARPRIAHLALWLCIHRGEGAWNDQGAPYYGGLQMTYGWDGLVQDAGNLSPTDQMMAAETGFRQHGYSVAWLRGQWPISSQSCLGYA